MEKRKSAFWGVAPQTALHVQDIQGPTAIAERLYELGVLPGETVVLKGRAPFKGPWIVSVRGVSVALREEEALCLQIKTPKE